MFENPTLAQTFIKDCLEKIVACYSHMLIIALNCIFKNFQKSNANKAVGTFT